ncbi:MAG: hypothetical protein ACLQPD_02425 [Desulfomonilaceae bacterium]
MSGIDDLEQITRITTDPAAEDQKNQSLGSLTGTGDVIDGAGDLVEAVFRGAADAGSTILQSAADVGGTILEGAAQVGSAVAENAPDVGEAAVAVVGAILCAITDS